MRPIWEKWVFPIICFLKRDPAEEEKKPTEMEINP